MSFVSKLPGPALYRPHQQPLASSLWPPSAHMADSDAFRKVLELGGTGERGLWRGMATVWGWEGGWVVEGQRLAEPRPPSPVSHPSGA